jgi:hypothetical protein
MIYFNNNQLYATNLFIIPTNNTGTNLPETGVDGQVFFVI